MKTIQRVLKHLAYSVFLIAGIIFTYAVLGPRNTGEAYIGDFESVPFNENWSYTDEDLNKTITLPYAEEVKKGETILLSNTLPSDIDDGMRLCMRSSMQDLTAYVDGELRAEYSSEKLQITYGNPPSSYVLMNLYKEDAGKPIQIRLTAKTGNRNNFNEVSISYGNNVWFPLLAYNLPVVVAAFFLIVFGILSTAICLLYYKKLSAGKAIAYLGMTMTIVGCWVVSESPIRQLLFHSPHLCNIYSFLYIETLGFFVSMYFNEVQKHKYNKIYMIVEICVMVQLGINSLLNFTQITPYYNTLLFSHLWMIFGIATGIITLIMDIRSKRLRAYSITATGMFAFLASCAVEVFGYYVMDFHILGLFLSIGLILLLIATVIQTFHDELSKQKEYQMHLKNATITTIETIASAIDAKDEYTGGHSERVAYYAATLANAVAKEYHFTQENISAIHYTGLMHDIGKIGIPDIILNKAGKLDPEEYELMKQHTVIGAELLSEIDNIEGLIDGVRHHHERYDGTGYPDGLAGEEIPVIARILCLADCYDAMTSNRIYRRRLTDSEVKKEILSCSGTQFDPHLVDILIALMDAGKLYVPTPVKNSSEEIDTMPSSIAMENLLLFHHNYSTQQELCNPAYIRMVSYLVKLAEKKNTPASIVLFTVEKNKTKSITTFAAGNDILNEAMNLVHDANNLFLQYTRNQKILLVNNKDSEQVHALVAEITHQFNKLDTDDEFELKVTWPQNQVPSSSQ